MLVQLKKQRIEDKKHVLVHFSADIQKGPPGEGFGMVVNVDDRHNIFVKRVLSCIVMKNATHNAHGEIRVGDEILGIDGESTAGWTLAR
jgi:C-terminal processing protease CtpA/Prc